MFLTSQLSELKSYIAQYELINLKVSAVSVGRHIDHSLIVIRDVMQQVIDSDPADYHRSFNLGRLVILTTGFIPRGRAKAPYFTLPSATLTPSDITSYFEQIEELLPTFEALTDNHKNFMHPFFEQLTLSQSKKNLIIHTDHHLKIIRDILK
jgi:hypothetical protein